MSCRYLTHRIMEEYGKGFDFSRSVFIAAGITKEHNLSEHQRKVEIFRRKIGREQKRNLIHEHQSDEENLENLSLYFQGMVVDKRNKEHRPNRILDSILRSGLEPIGTTLGLVTVFNLVADHVGVKGIGAYECSEGYYFSRHMYGSNKNHEMSYPIKRLRPDQHREMMKSKDGITNVGLV